MNRITRPALVAALALGVSTVSLLAQSPSPGPQPPAGAPPPPPPGHHGPPPSPLFEALDTNHDGVISADEIANAPTSLKKLVDASGQITKAVLGPPNHRPPPPGAGGGDGAAPDEGTDARPPHPQHGPRPNATHGQSAVVTPDASPTVDAPEPGRPGPHGDRGHHGPPPSPLFEALDANHDGVISGDEITNAPAELKKLDANNDGQLTRDELRPPPPPRPDGN